MELPAHLSLRTAIINPGGHVPDFSDRWRIGEDSLTRQAGTQVAEVVLWRKSVSETSVSGYWRRMGYYDLEDVLADGSEVPCKFQYSMPGLGYLAGNAGKPIEKNAKLMLPLWLARVLAIVGGSEGEEVADDEEALPFVELSRPEMFSGKVVNAIKAGAASLDLHSVNSHFYMLAIKWVALFGDAELGAVVAEMVMERSLELNGHASSVGVSAVESQASQAGSPFLLTLDESEKETYRRAHDSYRRTKRWMLER